MNQYKLVFSGDILPGHEADIVKARLAELLKVSSQGQARLFSGKPVVIKRGLDEAKADAYRRKLAAMGVGIRVMPDEPDPIEPAPTTGANSQGSADDAPGATPALSLNPAPAPTPGAAGADTDARAEAAAADEATMSCPSCGHVQPRRTLCQSCGVDMPRFIAAQQTLREAEEQQRMRQAEQPHTAAQAQDDDPPSYLGLRFKGRLSRRGFVIGNSVLVVAMTFALLLAAKTGMTPLLVIVVLLGYLLSLRLAVLRLHDFNWGGWWCLLYFVPLINIVFGLLVLFFPGTNGGNTFGEDYESPSWGRTLGAVIASIVLPGLMIASSPQDFARAGMTLARIMNPQMAALESADPSSLSMFGDAPSRPYDAASDTVTIYSTSACPACSLMKMKLDSHNIDYEELVLDRDQEAQARLIRILQDIDHQGDVSFPVVQVNGYVLTENPSLAEVSEYFGQ